VIFEEEEERNLMVVLVWPYNLKWKLYGLWNGVAWWRGEENFFVLHDREKKKERKRKFWCGVFLFLKEKVKE